MPCSGLGGRTEGSQEAPRRPPRASEHLRGAPSDFPYFCSKKTRGFRGVPGSILGASVVLNLVAAFWGASWTSLEGILWPLGAILARSWRPLGLPGGLSGGLLVASWASKKPPIGVPKVSRRPPRGLLEASLGFQGSKRPPGCLREASRRSLGGPQTTPNGSRMG